MLKRRDFFKGGISIGATALIASSQAYAQVASPAKWDFSYDIVIVGGGSAGLAAACEAVDRKISVVLLESQAFTGGSSALNGGMITVAGTKLQKEKGVNDSKELFIKDMMKAGDNKNDEKLVKALVDEILSHYEWLTEKLGVKPDELVQQGGQTVARSHHFNSSKLLMAMQQYAVDKGAKVITKARALQLVWNKDHSKIAGVEAEINGKKVYIEAKKGVLLSAGGFSRNPQLVGKYNPPLVKSSAISGMGTVGDGFLMGLSVGADTLDTAYIKATYGFILNPKTIDDLTQVYWSGGIIVNNKAERFVDESISYKKISDKALEQPEGKSFIVFDQAILEKDYKTNPQGRELFDPIFKENKVPSYLFRANTLEEAAKLAHLDPTALRKTVDQYNKEVIENNVAFGRKGLVGASGKLVPINKAPFYVMPATAALIATYCGLKINSDGKVINVYGKIIPGLWAAGEMTGGIHGAGYMSGSAFAKAQAFGRIAARSIASER